MDQRVSFITLVVTDLGLTTLAGNDGLHVLARSLGTAAPVAGSTVRLVAVNNECNGSPDKDLTFESAIDIKKNATNITVSYNVIRDSKKVGLMGHTQSGGTTDYQRNVTFHHNIYRNVNGRLPLQRLVRLLVRGHVERGAQPGGLALVLHHAGGKVHPPLAAVLVDDAELVAGRDGIAALPGQPALAHHVAVLGMDDVPEAAGEQLFARVAGEPLGRGVQVAKAGSLVDEDPGGHRLRHLAELAVAFAQGAGGAVQLRHVALQAVKAVQQLAPRGLAVLRRKRARLLRAAVLRVHRLQKAVPVVGKAVQRTQDLLHLAAKEVVQVQGWGEGGAHGRMGAYPAAPLAENGGFCPMDAV